MVRVIATFPLLPNRLMEAKKVAVLLVEATRKEVGCIQYDLLQDTRDEDHLVMVEVWEDETALEQHSHSAHFTKYVPMLAALCVCEPEVVTYRKWV